MASETYGLLAVSYEMGIGSGSDFGCELINSVVQVDVLLFCHGVIGKVPVTVFGLGSLSRLFIRDRRRFCL